MARVDYTGVPTAAPELQAPDDYQRVDATPASFGAAAAQGEESLGQGALDLNKFYGTVAADNATNNLITQSTAVLRGDPNKMVPGPDGKMVPDTGYFGMHGADAMAAHDETLQQLQDIVREQGQTLKTPEARLQYDTQSRRYLSQYQNEMGEHYDQQFQQWAIDTNANSIALAQNGVAAHLNNPDALAQDQQALRQAYVKLDQAKFGATDPAVTQGAILKADQAFYTTQISASIGSDPARAQKVLDQAGPVLASLPEYDQIVRKVKEADFNAKMAPATDAFVNDALAHAQGASSGTPGTAADLPSITGAIIGQESGGNPNAKTSVTGARGIGQIEPPTFAQYARPGENINNPVDNRAVAGRIIADYYQRYNGDPARVGVAYFSGPDNVAPAGSPTPWRRDIPDPTGKTTSSYVADIQSRLTKYPSTTDALSANMAPTLERAQQQAEQLFPNYPDEQERFVQGVQRRLDQTISQQHQQYEVDTHIVQAAMAGSNAPISEEQLTAISPQIAAAWQSMQVNNPYGAMGIDRMFNANAKGRAVGYGADIKGYLDRVLAPTTDPNRLSNPSGLWPYVGTGDNSELTNTGVNALGALMSVRGTPQGEAFASQAKGLFDVAHAELTFSNPSAGRTDPKGEQLFSQYVAQALPVMEAAYKNGTLADVMNPKSPNYVGNLAQHFMRQPAQIMKDRLMDQGPTAAEYKIMGDVDRGRTLLRSAVDSGALTQAQAVQFGEERGWFSKPSTGAPKALTSLPPMDSE